MRKMYIIILVVSTCMFLIILSTPLIQFRAAQLVLMLSGAFMASAIMNVFKRK